jgi:hypothetical protein
LTATHTQKGSAVLNWSNRSAEMVRYFKLQCLQTDIQIKYITPP